MKAGEIVTVNGTDYITIETKSELDGGCHGCVAYVGKSLIESMGLCLSLPSCHTDGQLINIQFAEVKT